MENVSCSGTIQYGDNKSVTLQKESIFLTNFSDENLYPKYSSLKVLSKLNDSQEYKVSESSQSMIKYSFLFFLVQFYRSMSFVISSGNINTLENPQKMIPPGSIAATASVSLICNCKIKKLLSNQ